MKTIIFSLLLVLGTSLTLKANSGSDEALKQSLSKKLQSILTMPDALKHENQSQKITMKFAVDEKGNVIAVNAETKNTDVKLNLEKQFLGINLSGLQPYLYNYIDVKFIVH